MKRSLTFCAILLMAGLLAACNEGPAPKIGVIDMNVLMKESAPGKAAQKFIETQENELQKAFEGIQEKLEKDPNNEKVLQELQQTYNSSQQKIQAIGQNTVMKLFDAIQGALQTFREKNGYDILLRSEALESYAPGLDVTRSALEEIDRIKLDFAAPAEPQNAQKTDSPAAPTASAPEAPAKK